ncbi:MAG: N-acetyltransferase family protein [Rikenellaceae bacterium]|nr:N-acetyltransferase family protein [Rikenellaceae bacterium]
MDNRITTGSSGAPEIEIREVSVEDAPAICAIYNHYIGKTAVTFETVPLTVDEMAGRIARVTGAGYPYYVAMADGEVAGYCHLRPFNSKQAFSLTAEISIYIHPAMHGRAIGSALMYRLLHGLDPDMFHTIIAGITLPNDASVALHEKFGFRQVGFMKETGRKFDRWHDVGYWQLLVG